jgi:hypothetical protein
MLVDYGSAGVYVDAQKGYVADAYESLVDNVYIKNNEFKPLYSAAISPKYGIYVEGAPGSTSEVYVFGNDHFPESPYTYIKHSEESGGIINLLKNSYMNASVKVDTSPYTVGDEDIVYVDASSGATLVTIPVAADYPDRVIRFKKTDETSLIVTLFQAASTIDGDTTFSLLSQHETVAIHSDGSDWWIL